MVLHVHHLLSVPSQDHRLLDDVALRVHTHVLPLGKPSNRIRRLLIVALGSLYLPLGQILFGCTNRSQTLTYNLEPFRWMNALVGLHAASTILIPPDLKPRLVGEVRGTTIFMPFDTAIAPAIGAHVEHFVLEWIIIVVGS